jgi:H+/Cl- antiporter ClcA
MIYVIAVVLGLATCIQSFRSEITESNIAHIKNDRPPNARASLLPYVPVMVLLYIGAAWILRKIIPEYATWILVSAFLVRTVLWWLSFTKLRAELDRTKGVHHTNDAA